MRGWTPILCVLAVMAPAAAAAQAELAGTYIQYLGTGANGGMINAANRSMIYSETGAAPFTCDTYFTGYASEQFTVHATHASGVLVGTNGVVGTTRSDIPTASGPTIAGNTIVWSGTLGAGAAQLAIDQTFTLDPGARHVQLTVRLTNTGTSPLTDVYYLRSGDPDFATCGIGGGPVTTNDVIRQPPADASALAVATAGLTVSVTLGIGAADTRARATFAADLFMVDAVAAWNAPIDPDGTASDVAHGVAFREPSLAAGASTTFTMYYVWGPDIPTVAARFDMVARGTACTPCDDGQFCTVGDCNDGSGCRGTARFCSDGLSCTADACDEATDSCTASIASGCLIDGSCRGAGSFNPANGCQVCDPARSTTGWSAVAAGGACSDGMYCTIGETCDAAGVCGGGTARSCDDGLVCTGDSCDEARDACSNPLTAGCRIMGDCHAAGTINPANPCEECRPADDVMRWSRRTGLTCGDASCTGSTLTPAPTCDGMGRCRPASMTMACPGGVPCATPTSCSAVCTSDAECPSDRYCLATACMPDLAEGATCLRGEMCRTGLCVDGVCCAGACGGTCESCNLPAMAGACAPYGSGTDPEDECPPPSSCNGMHACSPFDAGPFQPDAGGSGDAGPPPDAGPPFDAGPAADTGPRPDTGPGTGMDAGRPDGAAGSGYDVHGSGLFCATGAGGAAGRGTPVVLLALTALLLARRRRG